MRGWALAVLLLTACHDSDSPEVTTAKQAVAAKFAYPSGVEFRNIQRQARAVCGEARGRLLGGSTTDFRRFAFDPSSGSTTVENMHAHDGDMEFERTMSAMEDTIISSSCA